MVPSKSRARAAVASLTVALALCVPAVASAAGIPAAAASAYNSTPDCPVGPTAPVCSWNVPVDSGNAFTSQDYGECPYWAAEKYPSLVLDEFLSDPLETDWNGSTWLEHSQLEGLTTSSTPATGDLAVWGATAADPAGHVAYVEAIDGTSIIVSQMDGSSVAPFPAMQGSTEYISSENLVYYADAYNLEYIVTGDSSTTPLSYVEQPLPAATSSTTSSSSATSDRTSAVGSTVATAKTNAVTKKKKAVTKKKAVKKKKVVKKPAVKKKTTSEKHATTARTAR